MVGKFKVGTSFIDTGDIYYFGRGLPVLMCKDVYQYEIVLSSYKLTLQIFEINIKSGKIVHFYLIFLQFLIHF